MVRARREPLPANRRHELTARIPPASDPSNHRGNRAWLKYHGQHWERPRSNEVSPREKGLYTDGVRRSRIENTPRGASLSVRVRARDCRGSDFDGFV
jgi:hypothetical protein